MALITQDYFNMQTTTLGLKASFTPTSDVLQVLINEASAWIENECQRKFGTQTIVEVVRGKGMPATTPSSWPYPRVSSRTGTPGRRLILDHYPVSSVTSITWEDDYLNTGTVASSEYRILDGGMLEMKNLSDVWEQDRLYTVTYVLPDPVPSPIQRATALKVVDLLDPQYFPGKTKGVELISNVQAQIESLIDRYRRERIG